MPLALATFVERPLSVAASLDKGECGGGYLEACVIISSLISGIASLVWPGERIDRKRFVEAWQRFSGTPEAYRVSLPLLTRSLLPTRRTEAMALQQLRGGMFGAGYGARVVTGEDVDVDEATVIGTCPTVGRQEVRAHTYPALFYEHFRCALVHEYEFGTSASAWPMTAREADVSYFNDISHGRKIHFHVPWLITVTRTLASGADQAMAAGAVALPAAWWVDG